MRIKRLYETYDDNDFEEEDDTTYEDYEGVCIECGDNDIDYTDHDWGGGDKMYEYYTCMECGTHGYFEYDVKFSKNVRDE